jgi:glyoxylase-like metal-dependent hydrolase (beta-lactamase superfamily II)
MDQERPARFRLGGVDLAIVSDGVFMQDVGVIMGVVPRTLWEPVIGTPDARNLTPLALNCLLLRSQGKMVLVDTGIGTKLNETQRTRHFPGDYGHLLRRLRTMGVQPEDVDIVVNTHLHFDHCGWNTANVHGRPLPTFPNATYYIQRGEYEAAMHPNERTRGAYLPDNYAPLAEAGRIDLVDGERRVTPEITLLPTPGHTADHCSVAIASGGETAIYIGDLVQHAAQIERNAWIPAYDVLPLVTLETKKALFDRALRERWLIVSVHAPFPGAGRLVEADGRRRFVAAPASPHPPGVGPDRER